MKHFLKARYVITKDKSIKDPELLNLINEREEIKVGTQIVIKKQDKEFTLEVVEINRDKVWWEFV